MFTDEDPDVVLLDLHMPHRDGYEVLSELRQRVPPDAFLPIVRYENQPGIGLAIRKEILRRRGIVKSAALRTPGPRLDADDHKELDNLMARLDQKLAALTMPFPARLLRAG